VKEGKARCVTRRKSLTLPSCHRKKKTSPSLSSGAVVLCMAFLRPFGGDEAAAHADRA